MDFAKIVEAIGDNINEHMINYPKGLKEDHSFSKVYELLQKRGMRSIHPAWFYKYHTEFKEKGVQYIEDSKGILQLQFPKQLNIPHKKQICETLRIYSLLLRDKTIHRLFFKKTSSIFVNKYPICKEFQKSFLFQIGTCVYLCINSGSVNISAKYALLEPKSRRRLAEYKNETKGVTVKHANGKEYSVYGMENYGYSPNKLLYNEDINSQFR